MTKLNLHIVSKKGKGVKQEVQGVIVNRKGGEFDFNFNTAMDPRPNDLEFLKEFRNRFVKELSMLNVILANLPE